MWLKAMKCIAIVFYRTTILQTLNSGVCIIRD